MFTNTNRPSMCWGFARRAVVATTTVSGVDRGYTIDATTGTYDVALDPAATLGDGFVFGVYNSGSGTVTINPNGSETIRTPSGAATTLALTQGQGVLVMCDGTAFDVVSAVGVGSGGLSGLTTGRIVDAASSTTVETAATITTDQAIRLSSLTASRVPALDSNKEITTPATVTTGQTWAFTATMTVIDGSFRITGSSDPTKGVAFEADAQTAGATLTLAAGAQTNSRTLSVPVLTGNATLAVIENTNIFTKTQYIGDGTSVTYLIANGTGSGTGGGSAFAVQNGGANVMLFGNKSAIIGGAFDATPYFQAGPSGASNFELLGNFKCLNTTVATSTTSGSIINAGGMGNAGALYSGTMHNADATYILRSTATQPNAAAAQLGTLTNSPIAGNPTKWIAYLDNGVTRYIPTW
jgi:hypothetical protein